MITIYSDVSMIMIGTNYTGIPRVVMELSKRIYQNSDIELVLLEYNQKRDCFEIINTELFAEFCEKKSGNRQRMRTGQFLLFEEIGRGKNSAIFFDVDAVWKCRVRRSFLYPILKKNGIKIIPFVHDIIGITHPQYCPLDDLINFTDFVGAIVNYADEIILTSQTTKKYVTELYQKIGKAAPRIYITPLGGDFSKKTIKKKQISSEIRDIISRGSYLLMVGTIDPRKNHAFLLDAYDRGLKELGISVVIAGYIGWNIDDFMYRLKEHPNYNQGLYHIMGASDAEIDYLYENCFALAFPSYIEGYGLPIIESYIKGTLVFAADTEINKEIAGDFGIFFEKDSPESLVFAVKEYISDKSKYEEAKKKLKNYIAPTWEDCASKVCESFHNAEFSG